MSQKVCRKNVLNVGKKKKSGVLERGKEKKDTKQTTSKEEANDKGQHTPQEGELAFVAGKIWVGRISRGGSWAG